MIYTPETLFNNLLNSMAKQAQSFGATIRDSKPVATPAATPAATPIAPVATPAATPTAPVAAPAATPTAPVAAPTAPVRKGNYVTPTQFNAWRAQMKELAAAARASHTAGTTGGIKMYTPEEIRYLKNMVSTGEAGIMTPQDMRKSLALMKNIRNRYNAPVVYNNGAISYGKPTSPKDLTKGQVQVGRGIYMSAPKVPQLSISGNDNFEQFRNALHQSMAVKGMANRYRQGERRAKPVRLRDGSLYFGNQSGLTEYKNRLMPQNSSKTFYIGYTPSSAAKRPTPSRPRRYLKGTKPIDRLY